MRVTVDVDMGRRLVATYLNMKSLVGVDEVRRSSFRGYHLIARSLPLTYRQSLEVRSGLGECSTRLQFDSDLKSKKPRQILWRRKRDSRGRKGTVEPLDERSIVMSLPWLSKIERGSIVKVWRHVP